MATFESQCFAFFKFGFTKSDGKFLTLSQSDNKWMNQAKILDKKITTTDSAISLNKFKRNCLPLEEYEKFIDGLAKSANEIREKMTNCGAPGLSGVTQAASSSVVDRLTDTSKYTGAHKEQFDESDKGKRKSGRED